jgi:hypothetical protein
MTANTLIDPIAPWVSRELAGHPEALRFLDIVYRSIEVWDDIIDRDNGVTDEDVHAAFTALLLELPFNGFFERHKAALAPMISVVIVSWHASNALSRDTMGAIAHAYTLRKEFISLCLLVLTMTVGLQRAREVSIEAWGATAEADPFDDFQKGK